MRITFHCNVYICVLPFISFGCTFSGVHIPGSPFKIIVDGKKLGGDSESDTSLIKVSLELYLI